MAEQSEARPYRITGSTATAISSSIEAGIRAGALPPDTPLPTIRALADQLGTSPATAAAAYSALRRRGIVTTAGRNGTRVRPAPPIAPPRSAHKLSIPPGVRDFASGEPDPDLLPAATKAGYTTAGPLPELLAAARERTRALPASAGYTLVNGALDGMDRVLGAHLRPGDRVGVEDPGWAACLDLLAMQGLVPVPVGVDEEGPTTDGVRSAVTQGIRAIIITARAQNPTGAAISSARAKALRPMVGDILTIEDDHAAELAGVAWHPVVGGDGARWAFIRSASKPYGPDLRCAVLAGDPETVSRVEGRLRLTSGWVSTILQRTLLDLWKNFDLVPVAAGYDERRTALISALDHRGVVAHGRTGINVWVPVPDETLAVTSLRDRGYAVSPGHVFRQISPPGIRITIAGLRLSEVDDLADAIARICKSELRPTVSR